MASVISLANLNKHQLNTSISKAQYSFPKAQRFSEKKFNSPGKFYNLPSMLNISTGPFITSGTRLDFTRNSKGVPSPNLYQQRSQFDYKTNKKTCWTFGLKTQYRKRFMGKEFIQVDQNNPGPGQYENSWPIGAQRIKWTMRPKTGQHQLAQTPSPSSYKPKTEMSKNGIYYIQGLSNSKAPVLSPPQKYQKKISIEPGPGTYSPQIDLNNSGKYFLSNFKSKLGKSFPKAIREKNYNDYRPGPGEYRLPSDFGFYEKPITSLENSFVSKSGQFKDKMNKSMMI